MDTIPVEEVNQKMQVRYPMPEIIRNRDKTVKRRAKDNKPIFRREKGERFLEDFYPLPVKRKFFEAYMLGRNALPPATVKVFFHLCAELEYSHIKIAHDAKGEPVEIGSGGEVLAVMTQVGNRTRTQTYGEIAKAVGISEQSAREAVKAILTHSIAKEIDPHWSSVAKRTNKPGRPKDMVRLEISPEYAWCGPVEDGLVYLDAKTYGPHGWPSLKSRTAK